jgi:hypothetical protein
LAELQGQIEQLKKDKEGTATQLTAKMKELEAAVKAVQEKDNAFNQVLSAVITISLVLSNAKVW